MATSPLAILDAADHWRARAEEARTLADQMTTRQSKDAMRQIAHGYENMAERAELRAATPPRP
jgi:hypothetical protein